MNLKIFAVMAILILCATPSSAGILDALQITQWNYDRTVERTEDSITRTTTLQVQRTQTNEILRRQDLWTAMRSSFNRVGDLMQTQMQRIRDRVLDRQNFTSPKDTSVKDIAERNRIQQEIARRRQQDLMQMSRERSQALQQQIRDQIQRR